MLNTETHFHPERAAACVFPVRSASSRVMLELTTRCNAGCTHCLASATACDAPPELSLDVLKRFIDDLEQFGISELYLTGGEPRLYGGFYELLMYAQNKFERLSVATNGFRLPGEFIRRIEEVNLHHVNVSLDHHIAKLHDRLRGVEGIFEEAVKSIEILSQTGVRVTVSTVVTRDNIQSLERIAELAERLGASGTIFNWILPFGRAEVNRHVIPPKELYRKFVDSLVTMGKGGQPSESGAQILYRRYFSDKFTPLEACPGGRSHFFVDSYGRVSPCTFLSHLGEGMFRFGSIRNESFGSIVRSSEFSKAIQELSSRGYQTPACIRCEHLQHCGFGCPAFAYAWGEETDSIDPICALRSEKDGVSHG